MTKILQIYMVDNIYMKTYFWVGTPGDFHDLLWVVCSEVILADLGGPYAM